MSAAGCISGRVSTRRSRSAIRGALAFRRRFVMERGQIPGPDPFELANSPLETRARFRCQCPFLWHPRTTGRSILTSQPAASNVGGPSSALGVGKPCGLAGFSTLWALGWDDVTLTDRRNCGTSQRSHVIQVDQGTLRAVARFSIKHTRCVATKPKHQPTISGQTIGDTKPALVFDQKEQSVSIVPPYCLTVSNERQKTDADEIVHLIPFPQLRTREKKRKREKERQKR